jgi:hypothetical protein
MPTHAVKYGCHPVILLKKCRKMPTHAVKYGCHPVILLKKVVKCLHMLLNTVAIP